MPLMRRSTRKTIVSILWLFAKNEFKNVLNLMQTCKGRDKIFGLTLYVVDLYIKCRKLAHQSSPFITAIRDPKL